MYTLEMFILAFIVIVIIFSFIRNILNKRFNNLQKVDAEKLLKGILLKVDTDEFISWFLMRVQTEPFVDAEYEKYYKDNMLHFISSNNIYCEHQKRFKLNYSRLSKLIDKIYPEDIMSNTILWINNGVQGSELIRKHDNQKFYNRRVVSNEYIDFINEILMEFKDSIYYYLKIKSDVALEVLKEFLLLEIEIHMMNKKDLSSYYVEISSLHERVEVDVEDLNDVINFLIQQDYTSRLYKIGNRLYCSDFSLLYENMLSTVLKSTKYSKSFNKEVGLRFEDAVTKLLSKNYKTHRNAYIGNQDNEIDIVVEFGNLLFMIEVKARYYTDLEKEEKNKRDNARKKIDKGLKQIVKRFNMFKDGQDIVLNNGEVLDFNKYQEIIPMIVTLEDMFDIDDSSNKYNIPIMIMNFDELAGILDVTENVFQFTSYAFNWVFYPKQHQYLRLDKFCDFVLRHNYVEYKTPHGIYKEFEIRDLYSMKRIQRQLDVKEARGYFSLTNKEISTLLNNSYNIVREYVDLFVLLYNNQFMRMRNLEDLLNFKMKVNDNGTIFNLVFVSNILDLSPNEHGFIIDKENLTIIEVVKPKPNNKS